VQSAAGPQSSSNRRITIKDFAFAPALLQIAAGDTVILAQHRRRAAHVEIKNQKSSDTLMPGSTYHVSFAQAGDVEYFCSIHPYMTGTVRVVPGF
jgi:manganese oxidase